MSLEQKNKSVNSRNIAVIKMPRLSRLSYFKPIKIAKTKPAFTLAIAKAMIVEKNPRCKPDTGGAKATVATVKIRRIIRIFR